MSTRGCPAFDEDLSAWIDGELAAPRRSAVGAHLASCSACTARVAELRAVDRALRSLPEPAVRAALRERLGESLSGARPSAAPAMRRAPARHRFAPARHRFAPGRRRFAPGRRPALLALPVAAAAALALALLLRPAALPEDASLPPTLADAPAAGELEALDPEVLAVVLELDTIEDLPVIANLEVLERLIAAEAG
jgi:anti-sigma factor RsiW